jgi:hypothetical protein
MGIAVSADVEARRLLGSQVYGDGILILLAVASVDHCFKEALRPESRRVYQEGRGSDPMIDVGNIFPADALNMSAPLFKASFMKVARD